MQDIYGKTLHVGDKVAYVLGASSSPHLKTGHISRIINDNKCTVDGHPDIYASRILLLKSDTSKENKLTEAIEILQGYCENTACIKCQIEHAIGCAHKNIQQCNQPFCWNKNDIKKDIPEEGETSCS